ncbi:MAG TPA: maltose alpha-D-glucosyltransferase [Chlamydiae bacterium]|nr:maltose alpha-D-glucosyltransferase [Chlamydiota bacterium]
MKNIFFASLLLILSSFSFEDFDVDELEKESILYASEKLALNYSGKKAQWQNPYGFPKPTQILEKTSVWLDSYARSIIPKKGKTVIETLGDPDLWEVLTEIGIDGIHTGPMKEAGGIITGKHTPSIDGGFDRISLKIDPTFGTKEQYIQMADTIHSFNSVLIGDLIPGHTGLGADFVLALMNFKDYPGLYDLVEIDEKNWTLLPNVEKNEFAKNLNFNEVDKLYKKGYIVGRLQSVFAAGPDKISNWDATKKIKGADGKTRRWVYLHYYNAGQPTLNWLDPSFAADRLIAGDIMESLGILKNNGVRLDANGYLGVEIVPGKDTAFSEEHPLSTVATNLISMLTRKLNFAKSIGGITYQELHLSIADIKAMLEFGADFSYDFNTRPGYTHGIIAEDADFLRLNISLLDKAKIPPSRFIHALQNHDSLSYGLDEFKGNPDEKFEYKGKEYTGKEIADSILKEDLSVVQKKTSYGPCATFVELSALALGYKDFYNMTEDQKLLVQKAHQLLTFYNAMQPGIFMISGWDLVGAYPLKVSQIKELLEDGDCRWTNRGAYDLLGTSDEIISPSNLPKAKTLYGSLPEQLKDPSSYASFVKNMLKARKEYKINLATQVKILDVKNSSLFLAMYQLQDKSYLLVALNFSKEKAQEEFEIPQIKFKSAKNIITNKKEDKSFFSSKFNIKLDGFEAKAIVF